MGLVLAGPYGEGGIPGCHSARMATCTVVFRYNAQEVALIADEIGGHVIPGLKRYPSDEGGLDIGSVDVAGFVYDPKDREVIVIMASPLDGLSMRG
jgi:hypothetical protein